MSVELETVQNFRAEGLEQPGAPEKFVEIIEGELIAMTPPGRYHNCIATNILFLFREFCQVRADLTYGNDNEGFLLERRPDTLLSPDACLFRRRPASAGTWMEFAPEIAVEVLSPSNNATEMAFKRRKYFKHGTEQFWMLDPAPRTLEIHFADGRRLTAGDRDVVGGEGIAEGMKIELSEIFREP